MTKIFPLSQEENIVGEDEMLVRVPSLNRKAGKKEYEKKKKSKMGKNYGGLIPLVILTKRGKLRFLKPQGNVSYALLNLFNSYGFMTHPPFVY